MSRPAASTYSPIRLQPIAHGAGAWDIRPSDEYVVDVEQKPVDQSHLLNQTVNTFAWSQVTAYAKDHKSKIPLPILENVAGHIEAGQMLAIMGPSGCGKTTLLNILAHRNVPSGFSIEGGIYTNGGCPSVEDFRQLSSYVEQEDALIGSLTVYETMHFAARLAHRNSLSKAERIRRIKALVHSFGLTNQANTIIGTPIRKGLSGGQKRRLSVASALITGPKILFMDEPTSGLDSAASREVVSYIKQVAKQNNLIVIASIHQPSTTTFQLFDKLLLLSGGRSHYFGPVSDVARHFESLGLPIPERTNPAEHILDLMNIDFASDQIDASTRLDMIQSYWAASRESWELSAQIEAIARNGTITTVPQPLKRNFPALVMTLVHRSFIKSYRDVFAYGVRIAMYTGLAFMMGTVWLRLQTTQTDIQPYINAIFFGSAFMSFMAVAYVPAFLEDRATFIKERANGLYGATAFTVSNFIIGIPYLFLISFLFSLIAYWLSNFRPTGSAFFTWIMWLFLDLLAAESLVVLVSSIFPNFVISLALTAFANGLWMSVGGFLVPPGTLNVFWRYVFHYIDYQTYVFQGMMVNEFTGRTYSCATVGDKCHCMYQTELASQCQIAGTGVLEQYGYKTGHTGEWVGILIVIVFVYRVLGWVALAYKK